MKTKLIIENDQNKIKLTHKHIRLIKKVVNAALLEQGFNLKSVISVTITDNENIKEINKEHRNIDNATDVLSFPICEFNQGQLTDNSCDYFKGRLILGDIVLSFERAMEQSVEYGHSFEREIGFLVCHSVLHLLGYDHEDETERSEMRYHEKNIMNKIKLSR